MKTLLWVYVTQFILDRPKRTGETAQWERAGHLRVNYVRKCLLYKNEFDAKLPSKTQGMVVCTHNPRDGVGSRNRQIIRVCWPTSLAKSVSSGSQQEIL